MDPIKTREEAMALMAKYEKQIPLPPGFAEDMDALEDFFLTDEQKAEMADAEYRYALQIGIDQDFARFFYGRR